MAVKKNLVIVESPAKAKTIEKILGKKFQVVASFGHVRDLPKSKLGVDVEDNFKPSYSTIKGKGEVIKTLKAHAKKSDKIYLASDPDREGEAIAWHIAHALKLDENENNRIEFNEITENAIKESITHPRKIDMDKVNAQQARRILDRLVGYGISSLLWKSIASNTSAGRVQSVALKLICDLEDKIKKFVPVKYWDVKGNFSGNLNLVLNKISGEKIDKLTEEKYVSEIKKLEKKEFEIIEAKVTKKTKNSPNPLKTSTLQQLASSYLGFSASKTMRIAQGLYEGIDVDGTHKGLITYMRTDSIRISEMAQEMAKEYILENFGKEYLGKKKETKTKQKIQDAHEGIRPTDINLTPDFLVKYLDTDQLKLYRLIWQRFLVSQLAPMKYEQFELIANRDKFDFRGTINKIVFDGYYKVFKDEEDLPVGDFPEIKIGDKVKLEKLDIKEDYTKAPSRFTESSLVKKLESEGIGRPSTYASIIETLKKREYVKIEGKSFIPSALGYEIKEVLEENFPNIMDVKFTAELENELDDVADGEKDWVSLLKIFYTDLESYIEKFKIKVEEEANRIIESDMPCPCGKGNMILKTGRFGRYLACPNSDTDSDCKEKISLKGIEIDPEEIKNGKIYVKDRVEKLLKEKKGKETDVKTEDGAKYLLKVGRYGAYLESENYSQDKLRMPLPSEIRKKLKNNEVLEKDGVVLLNHMLQEIKDEEDRILKEAGVCEKCGKPFKIGRGRWGKFLACTGYPECKNIRKIAKNKEEK
ncbi:MULTISPECIES: type I DNA topoisomerase [Fusobacterium]|uniref:type I DNA topoisomerase n=1 Tax=uncultured Fusobacterium sp. TaxID=159267 RepID=UPI000C704A43|nr:MULTISPECIES: type I DNA topoisomerase [Fusobacterium]